MNTQDWIKEGLVKHRGWTTSKKIQSYVCKSIKIKPSLF